MNELKGKRSWLKRWREHRRARRQRALERWYLELDRARANGESRVPGELSIYATGSSSDSGGFFDAFGAGGDGGGGDGG